MQVNDPPAPSPPCAAWQEDGMLELSGEWRRDGPPVKVTGQPPKGHPVGYQISSLGTFDSTLPAFLLAHIRKVSSASTETEIRPSFEGLPDNLRGLLELAMAVPEELGTRPDPEAATPMARVGRFSLKIWGELHSLMKFAGQTVLSLGRFFRGRARFRATDFWMTLQQCGVEALPIVALISFLIGAILAFVGNVQLLAFGANLFIADLVGIAMVREMGVVMTGIIMSGRTGAAFAAHLGSMKANEEIDALRTFGFDPFDFLVLPRLIALVVMMPFLTVYANVAGILGGMLVGSFVGIPPVLYWTETLTSVNLTNTSLGVIKSVFFGAAIAITGCQQGMAAGKSSAAVGQATTRAVVTAITAVIVLDSIFAALFTLLDI